MKKRLVPIGLIFILVLLLGGLLYAGIKNSDSNIEDVSEQPELQVGKSESFGIDTPAVAPTATSLKVGSRYRVVEVLKKAYALNGIKYDMGTFVEEYKTTIIRGYCIDPGWKIPEAERVYILKSGGILVPKKDQVDRPLQRFIIIK